MPTWEYCTVAFNLQYPYNMGGGLITSELYCNGQHLPDWRGKPLAEYLNYLGAQGWELVASPNFTTFIFKRARKSM